jgi:hypothetical protein
MNYPVYSNIKVIISYVKERVEILTTYVQLLPPRRYETCHVIMKLYWP